MNDFFITDIEKKILDIHKEGYTGHGKKIAIIEPDLSDSHDETTSATAQAYSPDAEIKVFEFPSTNQANMVIDVLDWVGPNTMGVANLSFHGWDIDKIVKYKEIQMYRDIYDVYDAWFNTMVINCASANTGEEEYCMPAATKKWKDLCISLGACEWEGTQWIKRNFTTYNDRLDFLYPDRIYFNGKYHNGTSFVSPKMAGYETCIMNQLDELGKEYTPKTIYYLLRNQVNDLYSPGYDKMSGHGIIEPRLLKTHKLGKRTYVY